MMTFIDLLAALGAMVLIGLAAVVFMGLVMMVAGRDE
jgi:hypothetical protein